MMATHDILGDSLAKGLVHQLGREASAHADRKLQQFKASTIARKESRISRYREMVGHLKSFNVNGALRSLEVGEGKKRTWHSYAVDVDPEGGLILSHLWVPFKSPMEFDYENAPFYCHPHGHQRLLQIHGKIDPRLIYGIWVMHFKAFEEAYALHDGWPDAEDKSVLTFGTTEVMVWRPSTYRTSGWEAITAVSIDALYGPKLKAYLRLKAGYRDDQVMAVAPDDQTRYIGRSLHERIKAHFHVRRLEHASSEIKADILAA